ncbi:MAG: DEAD/DEAH box helicase [Cytophagales bacterium]|nr:MAG: DEAD/DEAH box helicase [Cytophagales bacterium]
MKKQNQKQVSKAPRIPKISHIHKPSNLSLIDWQIALRKQFGSDNVFEVKNLGDRPVYSDFSVLNPKNNNSYKVAIRSNQRGINFCTCKDFKTNELGTCKHIEYVLFQINNYPPYKRILQQEYTPEYTSIYLHYSKERSVKIRIGTQQSEAFKTLASQWFDTDFVLKENAYQHIETILQQANAIENQFRCYPDALEFILEKRERIIRLSKLQSLFKNDNIYEDLLKAKLFPYQKLGVESLLKSGRTLLADDMGLGKTLQAIGACEMLKKYFNVTKILVICPTSLKYQWKSEVNKFTYSSIKVIEGAFPTRKLMYEEDESTYKVVSYNTVVNDVSYINLMEPDIIILDEAQRIKNWQTKISTQVKKLYSKYAIVLTGTPLENKLEELYSVMQFVDLYKLGPLYSYLDKYQRKDEHGKIIGYQNLNSIGKQLEGVLIRRTKKEVLTQLPIRMDKNLFVPMTDEQTIMHSEYQAQVSKLVNKWKRMGFLDEKERQKLLINLNMMRMVCDSTYIVEPNEKHYDTKVDELMCILEEALTNPDQKVVIFSQWQRMTQLIAKELQEREMQFEYLHGNIPSKDREQLLINFKENPASKVFLSTDAGGVGLNLQTASLLINVDIPWNPAVLEQRIGRIYRLGQKENVQIINLISSGTIEHRMLDVLKFKNSMAAGVLDGGEDTIFLTDSKFNEFMKTVEGISSTETAVNKGTEIAEPYESEIVVPTLNEKQNKPENPGEQLSMFDLEEDEEVETAKPFQPNETVDLEPNELLAKGFDIFAQFAKALSTKEGSEKLMNQLIKKDEKTGEKYLKLPVENEKVVENAIHALASLAKLFKN